MNYSILITAPYNIFRNELLNVPKLHNELSGNKVTVIPSVMRKMKLVNSILYIIIMFLVYSCDQEHTESTKKNFSTPHPKVHNQQTIIKLSSDFQQVFTKYKEFVIDSSVKIGTINCFDVDNSGNILITDLQCANAVILNSSGKLVKYLSPEPCTPGFNWNPVKGYFIDDKIYIINAAPWGYIFNQNGNCIGEMSRKFLPPNILCEFNKNQLVAYYTLEGDMSIKKMDFLGNKCFSFGIFPEEYKNFIVRVEGGGLVVDKHQNIYQLNVCSPNIYKYDRNGKLIKVFKKYPGKFYKLKEDFSEDPGKMMKEAADAFKYVSLAQGLYLVNDDILLMKVKLGRNNYRLSLLNTNLDILHDYPFYSKENIICAKNNLLYFIKDEVIKDSVYINPKILVYKLNIIQDEG